MILKNTISSNMIWFAFPCSLTLCQLKSSKFSFSRETSFKSGKLSDHSGTSFKIAESAFEAAILFLKNVELLNLHYEYNFVEQKYV